MSTVAILTQKEKELVAVAASVASGCMSCTIQHLKLAREAGASDSEKLGTIAIALDVRDSATEMMAEIAHGSMNYEYPGKTESSSIGQSLENLVAIGAALACNSVAALEYYWTKASAAGVSTRQIQTAVGIARSIRKEAAETAESTTVSLLESNRANLDRQTGAGCQNADHSLLEHPREDPSAQGENQNQSVLPPCSCS